MFIATHKNWKLFKITQNILDPNKPASMWLKDEKTCKSMLKYTKKVVYSH